jgi:cytoskeletal protein RodZ
MSENKKGNEDSVSEAEVALSEKMRCAVLLREARENAGVSVEGVAMLTRISITFVVALEQGQWELLPNKVFVRGFIRSLTKAYGVSAQECLDQYERACGSEWAGPITIIRDENAHSVRLRGERDRELRFVDRIRILSPSHYFRGIPLVAGLIVLCGIASLLYIGTSHRTPPELIAPVMAPAPAATSSNVVASIPAGDGRVQDAPAPERLGPVATVSEHTAPEANEWAAVEGSPVAAQVKVNDFKVLDPDPKLGGGSATQVLDLVVREPVKIKMARDDGTWVVEELQADTYQLRFKNHAQLLLYDAAAVDVTFNGKALGPLGEKGRMRRLSFKSAKSEQSAKKF